MTEPTEDEAYDANGKPIYDIALDDHGDLKAKGVLGGKYSVVEQMLNKKEFERYKQDIRKIKAIMTDMQKYVTEHQLTIKRDLVTNTQLKIENELMTDDYMERFRTNMVDTNAMIKHQVLHCISKDEMNEVMKKKVDAVMFKSKMNSLLQQVGFVQATVDTQIPSMQNELRNGLRMKVNLDDLREHLEKKADKDMLQALLERMNKQEEVTQRLSSKLQAEGVGDEDEDESEQENEEAEGDGLGSPDSAKRKNTGPSVGMGANKAAVEQMNKKLDETEKKLVEMIQNLQSKYDESLEELKKTSEESSTSLKKCEQEIEIFKAAQKRALEEEASGGGKMGAAQQQVLAELQERVEVHDSEIDRLQRIDFRLSKELVSKPYAFIEKVKQELAEEQKKIVDIVKGNNDKYISRIGQIDQKVSSVLRETEAARHDFKQKVNDIKTKFENIRRFKEDINSRMSQLDQGYNMQIDACERNKEQVRSILESLALQYKNDIVDLKTSSEGFAREFDRIQVLFRELQTEFLKGVEEKRQNVDVLVRANKILKQKEIERAKNQAEQQCNITLEDLIPKLKQQHEIQNKNFTQRQGNILKLLKGSKLVDELSSPETRKYFSRNMSLNAESHVSLKGMLAGKKFIGGSSRVSLGSDMSHIPALLTQEQTPANFKHINIQSPVTHIRHRDMQSVDTGADSVHIGSRKYSHTPGGLPSLDYASRQEDKRKVKELLIEHLQTPSPMKGKLDDYAQKKTGPASVIGKI